ncbi:RnfABCDGE type electron transport complex subunit D [Metabacillus sp. GX 13764]|uniref:RnfABCDGE type electron transport complex subunit D n=1 Tax=Metabacillus kandeliae TaxID=2900151 RepID=UPI001E5DA991|nr:RnfABCDGE type electron transport complex subunit D [Metabacillus kandeliae]MCD7036071.1 RnfABCDGE type electron transport complex subunit D [Metabacillus kandeliae]
MNTHQTRAGRYERIEDRAAPHPLQKFFRTPKGYVLAILFILGAAGSLHAGGMEGIKSTGIAVLTAAVLDSILSFRLKKKLRLPDGAILTGLIIALVLNPAEPAYVPAAASAAAILSKHLFRVRKKPLFNPAAFGLLAVLLLFSSGQSWWGSLSLLPVWFAAILLIAGFLVTSKVNKFPQVLSFMGTYCLIMLIMAFMGTGAVSDALRNPFINSALFLAFFMVTDPPTSPAKYKDQVWFGIIAALVSCAVYFLFGGLSYLLIGLLAANAWKAFFTGKKLKIA